jgi:hypothetical protein
MDGRVDAWDANVPDAMGVVGSPDGSCVAALDELAPAVLACWWKMGWSASVCTAPPQLPVTNWPPNFSAPGMPLARLDQNPSPR